MRERASQWYMLGQGGHNPGAILLRCRHVPQSPSKKPDPSADGPYLTPPHWEAWDPLSRPNLLRFSGFSSTVEVPCKGPVGRFGADCQHYAICSSSMTWLVHGGPVYPRPCRPKPSAGMAGA